MQLAHCSNMLLLLLVWCSALVCSVRHGFVHP
jgi:hypothetical protein